MSFNSMDKVLRPCISEKNELIRVKTNKNVSLTELKKEAK